MDKLVPFLEKYVQWLVLGIAALYVGYTAFAYLYEQPLAGKLSGQTVTPGTIDPAIKTALVDPLAQAMKPTDDEKAGKFDAPLVTDVQGLFDKMLGEQNAPVLAFNNVNVASTHTDVQALTSSPVGPKVPQVDQMPALALATPDAVSTGRTVILVDAPEAGGAAAPAVPAADAGAGGAPAAPVQVRKDTDYVSVLFTIDREKMLAEVNRIYKDLPPNTFSTEWVQVEFLRQEMQPDGSWGPVTVVPPLASNNVLPYPGDSSTVQALFDYKNWLDDESHQQLLSNPPFCPTAPDAPQWVAPGVAVVDQGAAPGAAAAAEMQQRALEEQRQRELIQRQQFLRRTRQPTGMESRPSSYGPPPPPIVGPGSTPPTAPPQIFTPQPNVNSGQNVFDVAQGNKLQILAHDISIEEGRTYRYAARYRLFNPLFQKAVYATKKVADQFAIISPDPAVDLNGAGWTKPISVEPSEHVYVTRLSSFRDTATFDIYYWKDGKWVKSSTTTLSPGDSIRDIKGAGGRWTLVDVRKDASSLDKQYVVVMDDHGQLQNRDEADDKASPDRAKLDAVAVPAQ